VAESLPLGATRNSNRFYYAAIGYLVVVCGLLVLTGWEFNNSLFVIPGARPMNPMSAVTFVLCGIWLVLHFADEKKASALQSTICGFVIFFGALHTLTYFFPDMGFRMDFILFRKKLSSESTNDLIPPNTGLGFIFCGLAMLTAPTRKTWLLYSRQAVCVALILISYVSILGYIFQIEPRYTLGGFTPMSLFSALAFAMLSLGLLLTRKSVGISRMLTSGLPGGRLVRMAIPFIFVMPAVIGYLRLKGERMGYYPSEFGVEINTMTFIISVIAFLAFYFRLESKKQFVKYRSDLRLAMGEQKYRALLNSIKEGVVSINFDGKVIFCNPAFCKITGYDEAELLGKKAIEYLAPASRPGSLLRKIKDSSNPEEIYKEEIICKDGEKIWVSIKSNPIIDRNGGQYGYIATIDDITEDIRQVEDLGAFTVSAAHDLNSPVSRIITITDILNNTDLNEEQRMFLDIVTQTAYSMQDLLKDLLMFSKLGHQQMTKTLVDVNAVVSQCCAEQQPADFKGAVKNNPVPPVAANEGAVKRLYANLISNAFKYSAERDFPCIETGSFVKDGINVYYVKDNGSGIDTDYIHQLFTPFKRFHTGIEGTGMGLAIVKRIVEKHGGSVWAEPNTAGGLIFCFTLSPVATS